MVGRSHKRRGSGHSIQVDSVLSTFQPMATGTDAISLPGVSSSCVICLFSCCLQPVSSASIVFIPSSSCITIIDRFVFTPTFYVTCIHLCFLDGFIPCHLHPLFSYLHRLVSPVSIYLFSHRDPVSPVSISLFSLCLYPMSCAPIVFIPSYCVTSIYVFTPWSCVTCIHLFVFLMSSSCVICTHCFHTFIILCHLYSYLCFLASTISHLQPFSHLHSMSFAHIFVFPPSTCN